MGKWLAVLAAVGTVVLTTTMTKRKNSSWDKILNRSMNMMQNRNLRRMVKRSRKMLARWI